MATVFFSYSHADERLRDRLGIHLKTLEQAGLITSWHDRKILAGSDVDQSIYRELELADVVLLLVSADFLASAYCIDVELKRAMERHKAGACKVIPVILRTCDWRNNALFGNLLATPKDGKAIRSFRHLDEAFLQVVQAVRTALPQRAMPPTVPQSSLTDLGGTGIREAAHLHETPKRAVVKPGPKDRTGNDSARSGVPTPRPAVGSLDQWGRLIKSWATNLDYVSQPDAPQPPRRYWVNKIWAREAGRMPAPATIPDTDPKGRPRPWCLPAMTSVSVAREDGTEVELPRAVALTISEFHSKVVAAGIGLESMPAQYTHVVVIQGDAQTLVLRLPPKDVLQGSEDDLLNGQTYPLRPFYFALYGGPPDVPKDPAAIMELHANRVGDYTLNDEGNVSDLGQWGRLIKSWATNLDYVSQANAPQPPRDYWVNKTWPSELSQGPAPATVPDTDPEGRPRPWCLPAMTSVSVAREDGTEVELPRAVALTMDEFRSKVTAAGAGVVSMAAQYAYVVVVQGDTETLLLRLPSKKVLQDSEDNLLNGAMYLLRPFYSALYGGRPPNVPKDQDAIMELHANRIGEYTLNNCA